MKFVLVKFIELINWLCFSSVTTYTAIAVSLILRCIFYFTLALVIVNFGIWNTLFDCSSVRMSSLLFITHLDVAPESYTANVTLSYVYLHWLLLSTCFLHVLLLFISFPCNVNFHLIIFTFNLSSISICWFVFSSASTWLVSGLQ